MESVDRRSRHHIFKEIPQRATLNRSSLSPSRVSLIENSSVQSSLRESLFEVESICSVLQRLDSYTQAIQQLTERKLKAQLQKFNSFNEGSFEEQEILEQLIRYYQTIQQFEEVVCSYRMIRDSCTGNYKGVGIRVNTVEGTRDKLNRILSQIKERRNIVLQHSIQSQSGAETMGIDIAGEVKILETFIQTNKSIINELMVIVLEESENQHRGNEQALQRHKNIYNQLENVFESMKMMIETQKHIKKDIESMDQHFSNLKPKISQPHQLHKEMKKFSDEMAQKKSMYSRNKKTFEKNISNSYIRDYNQTLQQSISQYILFQRALEQYHNNVILFGTLYEYKSKLEQKLLKKNKSKEDVQHIKNIYRSLMDLPANDQLKEFKISLLKQHQSNLKQLGIEVPPLQDTGNCLLQTKIKQFHQLVEGGLSYMSINSKELNICRAEILQMFHSNTNAREKQLCQNYEKQLDVAIKLVEIYDRIRGNEYQIVQESLYDIMKQNSLGNLITNTLAQDFNRMCNYRMISELQKLFYRYIRDLIILCEISSQYRFVKDGLKAKIQMEGSSRITDDLIQLEYIQLIFPIIKSIRDLSQTDKQLKKYLLGNIYRVYYEYLYKQFEKGIPYLDRAAMEQSISNNPQHFNSLETLCFCQYSRRTSSFESRDFYPLLQHVIQYVCSTWQLYSLREKITQLVKLFFFKCILRSNSLKEESAYMFYATSVEFLIQYLSIDTEIRVVVTLLPRLTYDTPMFLQLVKLVKARNQSKYNPIDSNVASSSIRRLISELQSTAPFKISMNVPTDELILQLKLVEAHNDLQELSEFSILQVAKRALLYYYTQSIRNYRASPNIKEVQASVTKAETKHKIDLSNLNSKTIEFSKLYEQWVYDVQRRLNNQTIERRNYLYGYQIILLNSIV